METVAVSPLFEDGDTLVVLLISNSDKNVNRV